MEATPQVNIVSYTTKALELLIFTKSGRLDAGTTLAEITLWSPKKKLEHLDYMLNTIQSAFEFVDFTFHITNVSRAFTHQVVRTRTASFQQEAMRVVDARNFTYLKSCDDPLYEDAITYSLDKYAAMVDKGYPVQDCRGVLPTAMHTKIFVKANLRTLSQMALLRLCKRAEGEYQGVFKQMVERVLAIYPWAEPLLQVHCVKYGSCAFPNYTKCPIQKYCFDPSTIRDQIHRIWEKTNHVANPVAKDGRTM